MKPLGNILHSIHYIFLMCRQNSPRLSDMLGVCKSLNISYYLVTADVLILSLIWTGGHHRDRK